MEYTKFLEKILPRLKELELVRKRRLKNCMIASLFIILAPILGFLLMTHGKNTPLVLPGGLLFIFGSMFLISSIPWLMSENKRFKNTIKTNLSDVLFEAGGNLKTKKDLSLEKEFSLSGLFARYNTALADDKFEGKYKGVDFEIFEGSIPPFHGVVFAFDSNKKIQNRTIIVSKKDVSQKNSDIIRVWIPIMVVLSIVLAFSVNGELSLLKIFEYFLFCSLFFALFYVLGIFATKDISKESLGKINMEDVEFGKKFDVYSSDEVEARYLITPSFLERFQKLNTVFGTKKAKCAFYGQKVMFAISAKKDLFEIGSLYTPLDNPENVADFYKQMRAIPEMVDYFKLDEKTGL